MAEEEPLNERSRCQHCYVIIAWRPELNAWRGFDIGRGVHCDPRTPSLHHAPMPRILT